MRAAFRCRSSHYRLAALLALLTGCNQAPPEPSAAETAARQEEAKAEELQRFRRQVVNGTVEFDLIRTLADDTWMAEFAGRPIVSLSIVNRPVTNAGLAHLAGNTQLERLLMDGTDITDEGMKYLEGMTALKDISLSAGITDRGLAHVAGLKNLVAISMSDRITDDGLHHLLGLPKLESIGPLGTGVTGKGLDTLAPLKTLTGIRLFNAPITDDDLDKLLEFPELSYLHLAGTKITDAGLAKVAKIPKLKVLFLPNTAVTKQGIETLEKERPDLEDVVWP
jgi:hypothetical protein